MLDSALSRAEETLADRRLFGLDAERWAAFLAALFLFLPWMLTRLTDYTIHIFGNLGRYAH